MVNGELGALLATEMLPDALPAVVGANCAVKVVLSPAAIFAPADNPFALKPAPMALAWVIDTLSFPELVKVIVSDPVLPT